MFHMIVVVLLTINACGKSIPRPTEPTPTPTVEASSSPEPSPSPEPPIIIVCHKPGSKQRTLEIPIAELAAHLAHGDYKGACQ